MNVTKRQIVGLLALGLVASSCGGSTGAEPAFSTEIEEPTSTSENPATSLPGDGEILYQSQDIMCTQMVDGEILEAQTTCPEGTTNYWFLSDNTFVLEITNFDDDDEVERYHSSTLGGRQLWTKNETSDKAPAPDGFFSIDGNYLVINTDPCFAASKTELGAAPTPTPTEYRYNSLHVEIVYEYAPKTVKSNGFILETEAKSLYHTIATDPATNRPLTQQANQALYATFMTWPTHATRN